MKSITDINAHLYGLYTCSNGHTFKSDGTILYHLTHCNKCPECDSEELTLKLYEVGGKELKESPVWKGAKAS